MWTGQFVSVSSLAIGDNFLTKSNHVLTVVAFKLEGADTVILTTRNHLTQKQRDGHWHRKASVFKIESGENA